MSTYDYDDVQLGYTRRFTSSEDVFERLPNLEVTCWCEKSVRTLTREYWIKFGTQTCGAVGCRKL